jgi:hypothetical protein
MGGKRGHSVLWWACSQARFSRMFFNKPPRERMNIMKRRKRYLDSRMINARIALDPSLLMRNNKA